MHTFYHTFKTRPTLAQVTSAMSDAMRAGHPIINVGWGDGWIEAVLCPSGYLGHGRLLGHSGEDIVRGLNKTLPR